MNLKNLLLAILLLACLSISAQHSFCTEADSLMVKESFIEASKLYHHYYEQDTTNKQALISLANSYMLSGDITLAKKYYHQLENDSLYSKDAISKLAGIYESQQNLPKAILYYTILNRLNPENPAPFPLRMPVYCYASHNYSLLETESLPATVSFHFFHTVFLFFPDRN